MGFFDRFLPGRESAGDGGEPQVSAAEARLLGDLSSCGFGPVRVSLLFSGTVQGVGFRWTNQALARERGLTGWVRNLDDGRVEMEVQGEPALIDRHLEELHRRYQRFGSRVCLDSYRFAPCIEEGEFAVRM